MRRTMVERALRWLQENCPPYEDISIEESRLSCLPEDGSIFDALRSERESQSKGDDADQRVRCPHCGVQATRCTCFLSHVDPSAEEEDNNGGAQSNNLGPAYHQMPGPDDVSDTEEGVSTWGHYHDGSDVEDPVTLRVNILRALRRTRTVTLSHNRTTHVPQTTPQTLALSRVPDVTDPSI